MDDDAGEYLTIKAACPRLGVSPNTLRSWGAAGNETEYRHPMNNYRPYFKVDIENLRDGLTHPQPTEPGRAAQKTGDYRNRGRLSSLSTPMPSSAALTP